MKSIPLLVQKAITITIVSAFVILFLCYSLEYFLCSAVKGSPAWMHYVIAATWFVFIVVSTTINLYKKTKVNEEI